MVLTTELHRDGDLPPTVLPRCERCSNLRTIASNALAERTAQRQLIGLLFQSELALTVAEVFERLIEFDRLLEITTPQDAKDRIAEQMRLS